MIDWVYAVIAPASSALQAKSESSKTKSASQKQHSQHKSADVQHLAAKTSSKTGRRQSTSSNNVDRSVTMNGDLQKPHTENAMSPLSVDVTTKVCYWSFSTSQNIKILFNESLIESLFNEYVSVYNFCILHILSHLICSSLFFPLNFAYIKKKVFAKLSFSYLLNVVINLILFLELFQSLT